MGREAGPLLSGQHACTKFGDHARIVRETRNWQELRCEGKRIENKSPKRRRLS